MNPIKLIAVTLFVSGFVVSIVANVLYIIQDTEGWRVKSDRVLNGATNSMVAGIGILLFYGLSA